MLCHMWDLSSRPLPLAVKCRVLATGPPGESPNVSYNVGNDVNLLNAPYVPGIVLKIFHDFSPLIGKIVQSKHSSPHFTDEEMEALCH